MVRREGRPRLSSRRRAPRAGHRLAVSPADETLLRRSIPHASQAVGLLRRTKK